MQSEIDVESLHKNLDLIFGTSPTFITGSSDLRTDLREFGFDTVSPAGVAERPGRYPAVVMCISDLSELPGRGFFESSLGAAAMLVLPFTAFDPSPRAIHYGLKQLSSLDLTKQVVANRQRMDWLARLPSGFRILSDAGAADVSLGRDIRLLNAKLEVDIMPSEWASIAQYLEVTLVPVKTQRLRGFSFDGRLAVTGCSVAHHRYFTKDSAPRAERAWRLLAGVRISGGFPLTVEAEDSHISAVLTSAGRDLLPALLECVLPAEGSAVHEMSFASSSMNAGSVDWSVNSQFNEAAGGFHIAIGSGVRGAHIDFVSQEATID